MSIEVIGLWLAAICTLCVYSYLYSDNKFYRLLLNINVGVGVGYGFMTAWLQTLGPMWWDPMTAGFKSFSHGGQWAAIYGLILAGFGSLWYFQFSRKNLWLSRIVIGMSMGATAGVVFKQQFLMNMPQIADCFRPLVSGAASPTFQYGEPVMRTHGVIAGLAHVSAIQSVNNLLYAATIVGVMTYFFFSFSHEKMKSVRNTAKFGRWMLMISFGAFFGNTVMTRMSFFLERLQFLTTEWAPGKLPIFGGIPNWWVGVPIIAVIVIVTILVTKMRPPSKPGSPDETDEPTPVTVPTGN